MAAAVAVRKATKLRYTVSSLMDSLTAFIISVDRSVIGMANSGL
jgi:hypothetical protein